MKITRERLIQIIKEELTDQDLAVPGYRAPEEQQPAQPEPEMYELTLQGKGAYVTGKQINTVEPAGPSGYHATAGDVADRVGEDTIIKVKAGDLRKMFLLVAEAERDYLKQFGK
jgi:hypothetical protein